MSMNHLRLKILIAVSVHIFTLMPCLSFAQNIPELSIQVDNSLGSESSHLDTDDALKNNVISGGAARGVNLFHSFSEFNVPKDGSSFFYSSGNIENIVARVTGSNPSNIAGILGVMGDANLFFINPNGIAFLNGASLKLNGSFFATTADSLIFDNGFEFSASDLKAPPILLTTNIPAGLRFGENSSSIFNQAELLEVSSGKTIGLIGNKIFINESFIYAPNGNVEIGSVSETSLVKLSPSSFGWNSDYKNAAGFQNIVLDNTGIITTDINSLGSGNIQLTGNQIEVKNTQISALALGGSGGNVSIHASESLAIDFSNIVTGTLSTSNNKVGDIIINTKRLDISNKSSIDSSSESDSKSGNISVIATDSIKINNDSQLTAQSFGKGDSGNLTIETDELNIFDGGQLSVKSQGIGLAGNIKVNAKEILLNDGRIKAETKGGQGNIEIIGAKKLVLLNNSFISTNATDSANGGNITINSSILLALSPTGPNGSDIVANADTGNGGKISVNSQGVFGIEKRIAIPENQTNDFDASSKFGSSGQIQINTANDPSKSLIELPTTVVDPNSLVAQSPCRRGSRSEFTRSGRGGLPPSIGQDFNSDATQVALVTPASTSLDKQQTKPLTKSVESTTSALGSESPVVPAQGWVFNAKGEVVLVADNAIVAGAQRLKANPAGCPLP
jgi:filamentous hemagglutinin family protein